MTSPREPNSLAEEMHELLLLFQDVISKIEYRQTLVAIIMNTTDYAFTTRFKAEEQPFPPNTMQVEIDNADWLLSVQTWCLALDGLVRKGQRWLDKRYTSLVAIMQADEYINTIHIDPVLRPTPPNPSDFSISKRDWELSVMRWRHALQELECTIHLGGPDFEKV